MTIISQKRLSISVVKALGAMFLHNSGNAAEAMFHAEDDIRPYDARNVTSSGGYGLHLGPIRWRLWLRWIF